MVAHVIDVFFSTFAPQLESLHIKCHGPIVVVAVRDERDTCIVKSLWEILDEEILMDMLHDIVEQRDLAVIVRLCSFDTFVRVSYSPVWYPKDSTQVQVNSLLLNFLTQCDAPLEAAVKRHGEAMRWRQGLESIMHMSVKVKGCNDEVIHEQTLWVHQEERPVQIAQCILHSRFDDTMTMVVCVRVRVTGWMRYWFIPAFTLEQLAGFVHAGLEEGDNDDLNCVFDIGHEGAASNMLVVL